MPRSLLVIGALVAIGLIHVRSSHAQIARHHVDSLTRTATGARLVLRLQPVSYNTCHVVLAKPGQNVWNALKQHPVNHPLFRDLGSHSVPSQQFTQKIFDITYDHELYSGVKAILGARFQTNSQGYIHVFGGSSPDTELTMP